MREEKEEEVMKFQMGNKPMSTSCHFARVITNALVKSESGSNLQHSAFGYFSRDFDRSYR